MSQFTDRVILITGAGSGIGRQFARTLAAEGAKIAALDIRADLLDSLKAELKDRNIACATADVTDLQAVRTAVSQLEQSLGPTDVLIASAGIGRETSGLDYKGEDVAATIAINLIGVSNAIDAVLPGMRERRRGQLVALSSLASYHGLPLMAAYCASKSGVNALLEAIRVELRPLGIAVTTLCPGWIRTPLTENAGVTGVSMMTVEYAVGRMLEAIRSRRAFLAFPGKDLFQVRLLRYLPRFASDWLVSRLQVRVKRN